MLLKEEPTETTATSVAASVADLDGEEVWRFCFHLVGVVNAPEMPHEDSGVRLEVKLQRLKALNQLLNKLPAFQHAMERLAQTPRPVDCGGRQG